MDWCFTFGFYLLFLLFIHIVKNVIILYEMELLILYEH